MVETDLGEWIIQLAGQHPCHIIAPAVHLTRTRCADIFEAESGQRRRPTDREALVRPRPRPSAARCSRAPTSGISGVNLGVAETGTICVVEQRGQRSPGDVVAAASTWP